MTSLSIVIPSNNSRASLLNLLNSLDRQNVESKIKIETIIALDGVKPSNELQAAADANQFSTKLLALPERGTSETRNTAIAQSSGDTLLFLNDDVTLNPQFLDEHLSATDKHSDSHMILGRTDWQPHDNKTIMDSLIQSTSMIFFYDNMKPGNTYGFRHAWTLNLSMQRSIFERTSGFAKELRLPMYEDIELAFRLEKKGYSVFYHPQARATHNHRYTWESYIRREIMMGVMATVLWNTNRDCFQSIFKKSLYALVDEAKQAFSIDQSDTFQQYKFMKEQSSKLITKPLAKEQINSLYMTHLPTKRRAFRYGILKSARDIDMAWRERSSIAESACLPECLFLPDLFPPH